MDGLPEVGDGFCAGEVEGETAVYLPPIALQFVQGDFGGFVI